MRRVLLSLALLASLGAPARAGEVEDRQAKIARLEGERRPLETTHRNLERLKEQKLAESEKAAKRRAFNAKSKKAEAHEAGQRLDASQQRLNANARQLEAERRALVVAIDKQLAANPTDERLKRLRGQVTAKLPSAVKRLRVADERIDPRDDPEDLDEKAARLRKSENELLQALAREEQRATVLKNQAKLNKANQRSKDQIFQDGQKNRKSARSDQSENNLGAAAGDRNDATGGGGAGAGGAPPPSEPDSGAFNEDAESGPSPSPTGSGTPLGTEVAVDVVVQYSDVVDTTVIDQLRQAQKSSDPEVRAKAAENLAKALRARAERVKQQRQAIEKRAKQLRGN